MKLSLQRTDPTSVKYEAIELEIGKHILGRGSTLKCEDQRVSRRHCEIELTEDGIAILSPKHINPCFYRSVEDSSSLCMLKISEKRALKLGDQIGLLHDTFWFTINYISSDENTQIMSDRYLTSALANSAFKDSTLENVDADITHDSALSNGNDADFHCGRISPVAFISSSSILEISAKKGDGDEGPLKKRSKPNDLNFSNDVKPDIALLNVPLSVTVKPDPDDSSVKTLSSMAVKPEPDACDVKIKPDPDALLGTVKSESVPPQGDASNLPSGSGVNSEEKPPNSSISSQPQQRLRCVYGAGCLRKNHIHKLDFMHPSDPDWSQAPDCPWRDACYRRNLQHRASYHHAGPPVPRPPRFPPLLNIVPLPVIPLDRRQQAARYHRRPSRDDLDFDDSGMDDFSEGSSDDFYPSDDSI